MIEKEPQQHWDKVYTETESNKLGWYEVFPLQAAQLLGECNLNKSDAIIVVGAGLSPFVNFAVEQGYENVIVTDISAVAIDKLKGSLGDAKSAKISCIVDDVTASVELSKLSNISLWYDRAVLHFFVDEQQRLGYFTLLKKIVKSGRYVIIAVFSLTGAKKCSGLDAMNYDEKILQSYLGDEFDLIKHFDYVDYTPGGDARPYIYTLFKRK